MSGHHPFSNLTRDFSPERRRRVESVKADLVAQSPLREFRRDLAQTEAANPKHAPERVGARIKPPP